MLQISDDAEEVAGDLDRTRTASFGLAWLLSQPFDINCYCNFRRGTDKYDTACSSRRLEECVLDGLTFLHPWSATLVRFSGMSAPLVRI